MQRFTNVWVSTHGTSTPAGLNGRGSQASRSSDYKSAGREVQNQNVSRKIWWNRVVLRIQDLQWDRHQQSQQRPRDTLDKSLPPEDRTGSSCWKSQLGALCGAGETNSDSTVLGIHRLSPSTLLCVHSHFFGECSTRTKTFLPQIQASCGRRQLFPFSAAISVCEPLLVLFEM